MANARRLRKVFPALVQTLLAVPLILTAATPAEPKWHLRCPHCEAFALVIIGTLARPARAPPLCAQ